MVKIRRVEDDDLPALFEHFRTRYRFNPRIVERDYFEWQFRDPSSMHYNAYAAWDSQNPIGFIGFQPFTLRFKLQELSAAFSMQWFSDRRDGTGMRLFSAMMTEYQAQIMLLNTQESHRIFELMGMTGIRQFPRWVGFLAPEKVLSRFKIKQHQFRKLFIDSREKLISLVYNNTVRQVSSFTPGLEFLSPDNDVEAFARRNSSYLNWRYVSIPKHNYRLIEGGNRIAVWRNERIQGTEESVTRILEWTFPDKSIEGESAMAAIVADSLSENAILIDFHCTAVGIGNRLTSLGFYSSEALEPVFMPWLFRPLCLDPTVLVVNAAVNLPRDLSFDISKFYLTRGDADVDRVKL